MNSRAKVGKSVRDFNAPQRPELRGTGEIFEQRFCTLADRLLPGHIDVSPAQEPGVVHAFYLPLRGQPIE